MALQPRTSKSQQTRNKTFMKAIHFLMYWYLYVASRILRAPCSNYRGNILIWPVNYIYTRLKDGERQIITMKMRRVRKFCFHSTNWLAHLLRLRVILDSNFGPDSSFPDLRIFLSPSTKIPGQY